MADVTMPQLGETVADGTVTKWFKQVGDEVVKGEPLFEVSTEKVDTEIPAPASGTLSAILVEAGTTVDVGTTLARIGADETVAGASADAPTLAPAPAAVATSGSTRVPRVDADQKLSPVVRKLLGEHGLEASDVTGTGPNGRITRDDVLAHVASIPDAATSPAPSSLGSLSPVVRRMIAEHGLDPASLTGTGPDGRITRRDVEAAIAAGPSQSRATGESGDRVVAFTTVRRRTAEHMTRSKATSAHTLMVTETDYEHVDRVRRTHGEAFKASEGFSLTFLTFNAVAAVEALREFPHLNASVGDDELIVHGAVNLGIAVDLDGDGRVVPVVRDAPALDLRSMARAIRTLATGARTKRLTVDDMAGGTFTITNPGPFGTLLTGAVINQPQVAILSTDAVVRKPVVVTAADGSESIAIHSMGNLALTFDHRAIDGAYAARYLHRMGEILASHDWAADLQ